MDVKEKSTQKQNSCRKWFSWFLFCDAEFYRVRALLEPHLVVKKISPLGGSESFFPKVLNFPIVVYIIQRYNTDLDRIPQGGKSLSRDPAYPAHPQARFPALFHKTGYNPVGLE